MSGRTNFPKSSPQVIKNNIRTFLCDHNCWAMNIASGNGWHNG